MVASLQFRGFCIVIGVLALTAAARAEDPLVAARGARAQYDATQSALQQLYTQGVTTQEADEQVRKLEAAASVQLKEALDRYREAGLPGKGGAAEVKEYAEALRLHQDFDLAAEAYAKVITLSPDEGWLRVERGECLAKTGPAKRAEAYAVLREAISFELTSIYAARAWFQLGRFYFDDGLYEFAREAFNKVLEYQPEAVRTRIALAALDVRDGKVLEASMALDALGRAAQPYDIETRGLLRAGLRGFDSAHRVFKDTAQNHAAYARLLYRAGRVIEAITAGERAAALNPDDFNFLNFLGAIHMQMGSAAGARSAYERSLAANPLQPGIRESLDSIPTDAELNSKSQ